MNPLPLSHECNMNSNNINNNLHTYLFSGSHNQLEFTLQRGVQKQCKRIERYPSFVTDASARLLEVAFFPHNQPVSAFHCKDIRNITGRALIQYDFINNKYAIKICNRRTFNKIKNVMYRL